MGVDKLLKVGGLKLHARKMHRKIELINYLYNDGLLRFRLLVHALSLVPCLMLLMNHVTIVDYIYLDTSKVLTLEYFCSYRFKIKYVSIIIIIIIKQTLQYWTGVVCGEGQGKSSVVNTQQY